MALLQVKFICRNENVTLWTNANCVVTHFGTFGPRQISILLGFQSAILESFNFFFFFSFIYLFISWQLLASICGKTYLISGFYVPSRNRIWFYLFYLFYFTLLSLFYLFYFNLLSHSEFKKWEMELSLFTSGITLACNIYSTKQ